MPTTTTTIGIPENGQLVIVRVPDSVYAVLKVGDGVRPVAWLKPVKLVGINDDDFINNILSGVIPVKGHLHVDRTSSADFDILKIGDGKTDASALPPLLFAPSGAECDCKPEVEILIIGPQARVSIVSASVYTDALVVLDYDEWMDAEIDAYPVELPLMNNRHFRPHGLTVTVNGEIVWEEEGGSGIPLPPRPPPVIIPTGETWHETIDATLYHLVNIQFGDAKTVEDADETRTLTRHIEAPVETIVGAAPIPITRVGGTPPLPRNRVTVTTQAADLQNTVDITPLLETTPTVAPAAEVVELRLVHRAATANLTVITGAKGLENTVEIDPPISKVIEVVRDEASRAVIELDVLDNGLKAAVTYEVTGNVERPVIPPPVEPEPDVLVKLVHQPSEAIVTTSRDIVEAEAVETERMVYAPIATEITSEPVSGITIIADAPVANVTAEAFLPALGGIVEANITPDIETTTDVEGVDTIGGEGTLRQVVHAEVSVTRGTAEQEMTQIANIEHEIVTTDPALEEAKDIQLSLGGRVPSPFGLIVAIDLQIVHRQEGGSDNPLWPRQPLVVIHADETREVTVTAGIIFPAKINLIGVETAETVHAAGKCPVEIELPVSSTVSTILEPLVNVTTDMPPLPQAEWTINPEPDAHTVPVAEVDLPVDTKPVLEIVDGVGQTQTITSVASKFVISTEATTSEVGAQIDIPVSTTVEASVDDIPVSRSLNLLPGIKAALTVEVTGNVERPVIPPPVEPEPDVRVAILAPVAQNTVRTELDDVSTGADKALDIPITMDVAAVIDGDTPIIEAVIPQFGSRATVISIRERVQASADITPPLEAAPTAKVEDMPSIGKAITPLGVKVITQELTSPPVVIDVEYQMTEAIPTVVVTTQTKINSVQPSPFGLVVSINDEVVFEQDGGSGNPLPPTITPIEPPEDGLDVATDEPPLHKVTVVYTDDDIGAIDKDVKVAPNMTTVVEVEQCTQLHIEPDAPPQPETVVVTNDEPRTRGLDGAVTANLTSGVVIAVSPISRIVAEMEPPPDPKVTIEVKTSG